jgi:hypothetical protein
VCYSLLTFGDTIIHIENSVRVPKITEHERLSILGEGFQFPCIDLAEYGSTIVTCKMRIVCVTSL